MQKISTIIGKFTFIILRMAGRSGSALPGLIIEKFDKNYLRRSLDRLPQGFLVVTGTNGKTTTTKVISELLEAHGLKVLTNKTGSNFVRGVISTIVDASSWSGKLPYDIAVLEQDEAHAVHLVKRAQPKGVVALNIMRDQLDRFGEIDTTARKIGMVVKSASEFVVLNANDARVAGLAANAKNKDIVWFGHSEQLTSKFVSDDQHHSGDKIEFYQAENPTVCLVAQESGGATVKINKKEYPVKLRLDGPHNAINITAAVATVMQILPDADLDRITKKLSEIEPAFGRGETVELNSGAKLRVQLIKNPAGFTHSLNLLDDSGYDVVGIIINDDFPDGRDVSWLWDVTFNALFGAKSQILCGGTRGYDMSLRLKYDEIKAGNTFLNLDEFVRQVDGSLKTGQSGIVFCTYTAMLQFRSELANYSPNVKGSIL